MGARPFKLKIQDAPEVAVLSAVRAALSYHPAVSWAGRINSGRAWLKGKGGVERPVKFNDIDGCSDVIGQLKAAYGGRFVAIEVKTRTGKPTADQIAFLERVRLSGGVAGIARNADDAIKIINEATRTRTMVCA